MNTNNSKEKVFKGSVFKRLLKYIKPYWHLMTISLLIVLCITAFDLYRPILISNAIDDYINGYNAPYAVVDSSYEDNIEYEGVYLTKDTLDDSYEYYQLIMYDNRYYLFTGLSLNDTELLSDFEYNEDDISLNGSTLTLLDGDSQYSGEKLSVSQLKDIREYDFSGIGKCAVIYIILLVFTFIFNAMQTYLLQLTGQNIIYNIREEVFSHLQKLTLRFYDINPIGSLVTRATNDVEAVSEMYSNILVKLFKNSVKLIGYAVVMLSINVRMALYSFVLIPVIIIITIVFRKISRTTYRITRTKVTALNTFLSEHISGMKLIQIFVNENRKYDEFEFKSNDLYKAGFREMMVFAIFRPVINVLAKLALVVVILAGSHSVLTNAITIGTLYIFIDYITSFFEPIQDLAEQFSTLQSSLASAEKIFTVLDEKPLITVKENPEHLSNILGKIEFKHVWFAYEDDNYVLKDVSFTINPGESVAFVGATGAGKSSILNLIGRYYDIQKGEILIDGHNIKELDTKELRAAIGQVQQDVFVFTGDMKSNIRLRDESITDNEVIDAAKAVNAHGFIDSLPYKYNQRVTERGSTLSAGQRQLLSFARTLAYNPSILVMDEATANIDTETEQLIQDAIAKLMHGRTTIMVAHRLSTIQHCDNIIVMHRGEIRESGTHQELLKNENGIYKKLYELQL